MENDLIYRQAAIREIIREANADGSYGYMDAKDLVDLINRLPSAQPERIRGKWIYITDGYYEYFKCDQCEKHSGEPTPFCRYCGADMREKDEQKSDDGI